MRTRLSGGCDQENSRWRGTEFSKAEMYRLLKLRHVLSVWRAEVYGRVRADDEMRHVLRPQQRWQEADVRDGLPLRCADLYDDGRDPADPSRDSCEFVEIRWGRSEDEGFCDGPARS